jgi:glutaredoxin
VSETPSASARTPRQTSHVRLFHARDCSLCERARAQLAALRAELGFPYEEVDITGVDELEARYREWLPVVEIDGDRAFVYYLDEAAFRRKVRH